MEQKNIIILLLSLLFSTQICYCQPGNYSAAGYTAKLVDYINSYHIPDISGTSGSISYTFSSVTINLDLDGFFFNQDPTSFFIGWADTEFKITFNYHVCEVICESGYVNIYTTSENITLSTELILDYSTYIANFNLTQTTIDSDKGDIVIEAHCTDTICLIPVGDISNAISNSFVPTLTNGITNGLNEYLEAPQNYIYTFIKLPESFNDVTFQIDCTGQLVEASNSPSYYPPQMTAEFMGTVFASINETVVPVPFSPNYIPDTSYLENIDAPIVVTLTPYIFQSVVYTGLAVLLPVTVQPNEIPAASPIKLNTSDSFFSSIAPGLLQYPNLGLLLNVSSNNYIPTVTINATGMTVEVAVEADFTILSQPLQYAFGVKIDLQVEIVNDVTVLNSTTIELSSKILNIVPSSSITYSNVGQVDPTGFNQLVQMVEGFIKVPSFNITLPSQIQISNTTINFYDNIIQIPIHGTISP
ncbi:hypothetical protein PPL_06754 [Heterostelium album PN500]|uniref:Lipid-binding serum glycoprotein C-terminal domain-containing protein n=1 Tax=Heterostelium pallidum (strain ATCC 26659 / Pp 5 / PN500) TaxID=670386 RepID=D3BFL9_HETP5|nr:hypothetical protein PPL_06754 [Heterostelium album PN500]EFA79933.1 hypothetical protein PPL_06754 [Heterostelium album PN500]|eukprot:XP_020432053.1 hypothetical protein PPL_06754 [Heterostelium album PN500]